MKKKFSWLLVVLCIAGCSDEGGGPSARDRGPEWLDGLPASSTEAAAGDLVFAVLPKAGYPVEVGSFRVIAVTESEVTIADDIGNEYEGIPSALIHSRKRDFTGDLGDVVIADHWNAHHVVGRVVESSSPTHSGTVIAFDWNGRTMVEQPSSIAPFAAESILGWVRYLNDDQQWRKGLRFAQDSTRSWIREDGGGVHIAANVDVSSYEPVLTENLRAGAQVSAYLFGRGFIPATVSEVIEKDLRYRLLLSTGETVDLFFENLSAAS